MVFPNDDYVKWDKVTNPRDFNWESLVDMQHKGEPGLIAVLSLLEAHADVEVVIQGVRDNINNYAIIGHFLDRDCTNDVEVWYLMKVSFFTNLDYATVQFIPYPISTATFLDKPYIERRRSAEPSN